MAHKRGKKALYEVMSKARKKPGFGRTLEKMLPEKPVFKEEEEEEKEVTEVVVKKKSEAGVETSKTAAKWWKKPRAVQFNVGRIEFSIPYQLAVALILGIVLVFLASFQIGQKLDLTDNNPHKPVLEATRMSVQENSPEQQPEIILPTSPIEEDISNSMKIEEPIEVSKEEVKEEPKPANPDTVKPTGNNVIVLVQFGSREDLRPVQAHFADHGIETEIVPEKGTYFLQTKTRYINNPGTPGTDGYEALQKIIKAGALYKGKAPPNYETFAPHFFSDAYGKKMK
ncbi:MAG: hypothetical protein JW837_15905 [Sedimentisphaerales bacterium]|nr:hypothetical protein [Sedimentisphaerales bacterium]